MKIKQFPNTTMLVILLFISIHHTVSSQQLTPVRIGTQVWSSENINRSGTNSWCYLEQEQYCSKYGRLYTWDAAKMACPAGWHLPTQAEWKTLIDYLGGEESAASNLASQQTGFNLKYGGMARIGNYMLIDNYCAFWTSSNYDKDHAWYVYLSPGSSTITMTYFTRQYGFSVRCLKD